jgi:hypothetical protein
LNGTEVRNLKHLAELVIACKEQYMRFEMVSAFDVAH